MWLKIGLVWGRKVSLGLYGGTGDGCCLWGLFLADRDS